ncbi:MAG: 2-C-methyl-D-erythritol 2,4-cyclodiphosphate synthase [Desulfurellaceae bacterium]|jgi:2-C-methyl-D-erythritol 2,4-cyclodiphosphate synthase|nr:2-C-methyl-D-erythritol 2,4-cyclodiphosphate synthase [Desulfurellaceae bacterium]
MSFKVGIGFDAHQFTEGRKLILGGVRIDYPLGLDGWSDADVLTHAICDALLGAAGMDDIGTHFPNVEQYKDVSSMMFLEETREMLDKKSFYICNIDVTIIAQKPTISPYKQKMKENIAYTLKIKIDQINIKATTTDKMGFTGRGEGIAVLAIVGLGM